MVATHRMLPDNQGKRSLIEEYLEQHTELASLIERFERHVRAIHNDADVTLYWFNFDEWDPPILVQVIANVAPDEYVKALHELRDWYQSDPDRDETTSRMSLIMRDEGR